MAQLDILPFFHAGIILRDDFPELVVRLDYIFKVFGMGEGGGCPL